MYIHLDLKDVVGSDNKLERFINLEKIDPKLCMIPKLNPMVEKDLNEKGILTTYHLIGKFMEFNLDYFKCVDWIKAATTYNQSKHIVTVVLYRLEMIGFIIPDLPENWRHY